MRPITIDNDGKPWQVVQARDRTEMLRYMVAVSACQIGRGFSIRYATAGEATALASERAARAMRGEAPDDLFGIEI